MGERSDVQHEKILQNKQNERRFANARRQQQQQRQQRRHSHRRMWPRRRRRPRWRRWRRRINFNNSASSSVISSVCSSVSSSDSCRDDRGITYKCVCGSQLFVSTTALCHICQVNCAWALSTHQSHFVPAGVRVPQLHSVTMQWARHRAADRSRLNNTAASACRCCCCFCCYSLLFCC